MNGVIYPINISDHYPGNAVPHEPPYYPAEKITATTPTIHDIAIRNLVATGARMASIIAGLPESCIHHVTMNNVSIQTSSPGMELRHMTGTFTNVTITPPAPNTPFVLQENVTVATAGSTPAIPATAPQAGQTACAQEVPGS